jgi:hypothetical protein
LIPPLLEELADEPIDGDRDLVTADLWLAAFFESGPLSGRPLIAFAVAEASRRDRTSPFSPGWMLQRGLEHILEFCDELAFFFWA